MRIEMSDSTLQIAKYERHLQMDAQGFALAVFFPFVFLYA